VAPPSVGLRRRGSARAWVDVREVDVEQRSDLVSLASLWTRSREQHRLSARSDIPNQLRTALSRDGVTGLVARLEGADVGFLVLSCGPLLPLLDEPAVAIDHMFVLPDVRRQGVGKALIARATSLADQQGAGQISTSVPAAGRDGQRFFARLGFSPFVVRRVAPVAVLRRRLVVAPCPALDATVLRRRSLRARSRALAVRARPGV
jgi:GNAT superfamily N-acetyltransferase